MPQPSNDNRPAEFDAQLVRYLPGLHKLAIKLRPLNRNDERDELVQATLCKALEAWRSYRPENSPYTWLQYLMRSINQVDIKKAKQQREIASRMAGAEYQAALPSQEHSVALSDVLAGMAPDIRDDMVEVAMGSDMAVVGARRGVTRERVRQVFAAERARWASLERRADTRRALAA